MIKKTLGGDRLGSGKKMQIELHNYERSTHDMGYPFRTTMSAGTLVPFMKIPVQPGDTFDINLECDIKTHPTVGPLFGSFKVQLDVFLADMRLYQGKLHNNKLGIGNNMSVAKLPQITLTATPTAPGTMPDIDNAQINPSAIMAYLGIRGVGRTLVEADRTFQAIPWLAYWDIYKNYYANKQEEIGAVIHTEVADLNETVDSIDVDGVALPENPTVGSLALTDGTTFEVNYTGARPDPATIMIRLAIGGQTPLSVLATEVSDSGTIITLIYNYIENGEQTALNWRYTGTGEPVIGEIGIETFPLENIDNMRESILAWTQNSAAFNVNLEDYAPYNLILGNNQPSLLQSQEGLALKTYQSDLFNNWLQTEWIDGTGGVSDVTKVVTTSGSFTIDTLNLAKKVYDMLNRIAVSGGSYDDWIDAVYTHDRHTKPETPIYLGGLSKELVFQEVVNNSESQGTDGTQPLGTLAGKGIMGHKHKGGRVTAKVNEPGYLIGIVSLTPRVDYSQGNDWDIHLTSMDDWHKPALDEIGFQELPCERMAWWDTINVDNVWVTHSAGKQPAWIEYMTAVPKVLGNFAIGDGNTVGEMFMTLNRRYQENESTGQIDDLTTYVDPAKFNHIFAETALDSQNFWCQIAVDIEARRKISAKLMPNL